jgi:hypothetical protein
MHCIHVLPLRNTLYIIEVLCPFHHKVQRDKVNKKRLYWCVAYLPSEASIVEH